MNERIKEIAKDAGVLGDWGEDASEGRFFITGNTKQMEKFAELIVRECISTIENAENGYQDYRSQIEDAMRDHCVWLIKQKFGVK